ncbi:MAG TPA: zf-HC2 domain-containing protein [Actinomycetota bacterium]
MTTNHREREQLSAYLDGELGDVERTTLEAHISTCEQCAGTLAALRATAGDLRLLAEAEPTPQDAWALRSAIARARRAQRGPRWARVAMASSASAAALALIVGSVVFLGGSGDDDRFAQTGVEISGPSSLAFGVEVLDEAFDQTSARGLFPTRDPAVAAEAAPGDGSGRDDAAQFSGGAPAAQQDLRSADADLNAHRVRIEACESALFGDDEGVERTPQRYIVARYNQVDAYFLLYLLPSEERYELWVIARADCDNVLLFEQRAA